MRALARAGIDLLYPPLCPLCGQPDQQFCERCRAELATGALDFILREDLAGVDGLRASGAHRGILLEGIHALKYGGRRELAAPLGERLWRCLDGRWPPLEAIVPVPLHDERLSERGFNQAELLAAALGRRIRLPVRAEWLSRERYTESQVGLSAARRARNVAGAFAASAAVAGKCLLLIDDVCTSGATLTACAQALRFAGARLVWALTVSAPRP